MRFWKNIPLVVALVIGFSANPSVAELSEQQFEQMIGKYLSTEKGQAELGKALESYGRKQQEAARKARETQMQAELESQFKNPVSVEIGKSPAKGAADAKITIVEFSDFQCPYCKRANNTMDELEKMYPNQLKRIFKNVPLPFHDQAAPAAKAALAAGKQGKFWEFHHALFENQQKLSDQLYLDQAKQIGLDVEKFKADMKSPEIEQALKDDQAVASKLSVEGTPAFFVNGVAVRGAYPKEHFKMIIDRLLSTNKG